MGIKGLIEEAAMFGSECCDRCIDMVDTVVSAASSSSFNDLCCPLPYVDEMYVSHVPSLFLL